MKMTDFLRCRIYSDITSTILAHSPDKKLANNIHSFPLAPKAPSSTMIIFLTLVIFASQVFTAFDLNSEALYYRNTGLKDN